jgi:hypothetical protein
MIGSSSSCTFPGVLRVSFSLSLDVCSLSSKRLSISSSSSSSTSVLYGLLVVLVASLGVLTAG